MDTYSINKDKVKIHLTNDEVNSLFGGYDMIDYSCPRSKAVLDSLLSKNLPDDMLPLDCGKILIEVIEEHSGCSIQITRIYDKGKRLYKKGNRHKYILLFNSSEDMFLFVEQIDDETLSSFKNSKLLKIEDKYALLFAKDSTLKHFFSHLCEYGKIIDSKSILGSKLLEYGVILSNNATEKLFSVFKKQ